MGIDVSVNLNAFNFASFGNKRVREVGDLSVVTFSTNFTSRVTSLLNVSWILREPSLVSLICGLVSIVLVPLIRKDGGPCLCTEAGRKERTVFQLL